MVDREFIRKNRGNLIEMRYFFLFLQKWSWGLLNRFKMLPPSPLTLRFSTIGKPGHIQAMAWPWPGPQDGLGQGGPRLKWAKGRFGSKNDEKVKVLRMEFSVVENLSGHRESIFSLF